MDNFWKEAVKVTGPIAVVGFILAFVVEKIFQENVLVIFGSDRVYYLTFFIIAVLAFALVFYHHDNLAVVLIVVPLTFFLLLHS